MFSTPIPRQKMIQNAIIFKIGQLYGIVLLVYHLRKLRMQFVQLGLKSFSNCRVILPLIDWMFWHTAQLQ